MRFSTLTLVAVAIVSALLADDAKAGPFRRRAVATSTTTTCTSDGCGTVSSTTSNRTVLRGSNATAQAVAELQAANGAMAHHGGNTSFEGVGCGGSPEAALNACCNNGRPVVDQGVAQGRDGRWYACKRYAR